MEDNVGTPIIFGFHKDLDENSNFASMLTNVDCQYFFETDVMHMSDEPENLPMIQHAVLPKPGGITAHVVMLNH